MKKKLIVANWKMHPASLQEARRLFKRVVRRATRVRNARVVICPPLLYLAGLTRSYRGTSVLFGAQDVSAERKTGSFTGEVSATMLRGFGVSYVLVGHSERRARGETDERVAQKLGAALAAGLSPILCVGEHVRDEDGQYLKFLERQIQRSLAGVPREHARRLVVAYEPIWAIGKTAHDAATPRDVHEITLFIRKVLVHLYGRKTGRAISILYGGSVEPDNAGLLTEAGNVDGFLVGHASLVPEDFMAIVRAR